MKILFLLCVVLPFGLMAQDCQLKKGQDAITSKPTLSTGFIEHNQLLGVVLVEALIYSEPFIIAIWFY